MNNTPSSFLAMAASLRCIWRRLSSWRAAVWLALCMCAIGSAAACPLQAPKAQFTNLAGLPGLHADAIAGRLAEYQQVSGHQLFVLVLPSLGDSSIEKCAVAVFQHWKIGRKGVNDGVLLLVAVMEHKMRIEVGYGLESVLTDAQSSRIIHEVMQPSFARGDFAEGIDGGIGAIMAVIGSTRPPLPADEPVRSAADDPVNGKAARIFGAVFLLIFLVASPIMGIVGLLAFGAPPICLRNGCTRIGAPIWWPRCGSWPGGHCAGG